MCAVLVSLFVVSCLEWLLFFSPKLLCYCLKLGTAGSSLSLIIIGCSHHLALITCLTLGEQVVASFGETDMLRRLLCSSAALGSAVRLQTRFTERIGAECPLVLAPMGGCAGGALAAAVSGAGGVGFVGSGGETVEYLREEWTRAVTDPRVRRPLLGFGLNVAQLEALPAGTLEALLAELQPAHVYLSFGNITPHAAAVLDAGAAVYSNAGDCETAVAHAAAGATCVVMQGSDAGGHTHERASAFALIPQARSALDDAGYHDTLLVAAGGISDGRGVAGALALGADAAVLGTRFAAAAESTYDELQKQALVRVQCGASGTTIGRWIDKVNGIDEHSSGLPGRCIINGSTRLGVREELPLEVRRQIHREGVAAAGDGLEWGTTWAGAAVGLVRDIQPAAEIVAEVSAEAAAALDRGARFVRPA